MPIPDPAPPQPELGPNQEAYWDDAYGWWRIRDKSVMPPPPTVVVTYKADIWRRATDAEAEAIQASIDAQPARKRNLFRDALYLQHDDLEFAELRAGFTAAFGEARAKELLAVSAYIPG